MLRLISERWGAIGLSPDLDAEGRMVSDDLILNNGEMAIRIREWSGPSCHAVLGTFHFLANEQVVFSGLDASFVLVVLFNHSARIQFAGITRDLHDRGTYLLISGRSVAVQFFAGQVYQLSLIGYLAGFAGGLPDADKVSRMATNAPAWYQPRAMICTPAMRLVLKRIANETAGLQNEDGRLMRLCREILVAYLSPAKARFQPTHLLADHLDEFYAARDRLLGMIDRTVSFSKLMSLAGIRDRPLFRKRMNQVYGLNIRDFIVQARMEKAVKLLADFSLSIKQIASKTGFKNAFYFSRVFSRYFGQPPKSYRSGGC